MIKENKVSKYIFYAIGEIVLVVIGILIALQVNNWNEERKTNQIEQSALIELKANLLADVNDFQADLRGYSTAVNSCSIIIDFIDGKTPYNDSLNLHFGNIRIQGVFAPTKVVYENLKQSDINLISTDSLRNAISDLYEVKYKYVEKYLEAEYQLDHQVLGYFYLKEMQEYSPYKYAKPVDFNRLIHNQEFRNLLMHRKMKIEDWYENLYKGVIRSASHVIEMIDEEVKN